ncbi:site-specific integrase [Synechococcus sp. CS-602]|uniref:site-specific integrase n=1 Tax=unclassified Synechococcus TaxID=2626047 RepID=UPI0008FF1549|nr:integrase [Synechococcus sp. SynAce01]MCT0201934.1 site-specific integrase [Synechococcus sp. CS-603]MCT0205510.1 site-specific integrase [Synechococcus sp. CS-602]MCT0246953.1 site-specific integrase [Synechococcus sp. CS-601]TWB91868.1 phage integrase family protein [Synechococcus sp. Ace-Pa]
MDQVALDSELRRHNDLLAASGVSLRLERRGQRLVLRGPLPCRRGGGNFPVQRISLGLPATAAGLTQARRDLRRLQQQLQQQRFDWQAWSHPSSPPTSEPSTVSTAASTAAVLEHFEASFFADPRRRRHPSGSRSTWQGAYLPYLRRLLAAATRQHRQLDPDLFLQVLESYPAASRSRQQCGTALAALGRQLGLSLAEDWGERSGGYGLHQAQFRQLPSDDDVQAHVARIPNPAWRLAYGLMATYGLRNHEVFFCDLSPLAPGGDRVLRVLPTSKTGEHQVWPFHPEWVELFELPKLVEAAGALPAVRTDLTRTTLQQVGRRVAEQFRRYDLPITPYDLRHAWAVRTIHIGLPDTVAARMMGHSVTIHTRTYHHWITRRDQQQAVDAALARRRVA